MALVYASVFLSCTRARTDRFFLSPLQFRPLLRHLTAAEFADSVLPVLQKQTKRSPEVVLTAAAVILHHRCSVLCAVVALAHCLPARPRSTTHRTPLRCWTC